MVNYISGHEDFWVWHIHKQTCWQEYFISGRAKMYSQQPHSLALTLWWLCERLVLQEGIWLNPPKSGTLHGLKKNLQWHFSIWYVLCCCGRGREHCMLLVWVCNLVSTCLVIDASEMAGWWQKELHIRNIFAFSRVTMMVIELTFFFFFPANSPFCEKWPSWQVWNFSLSLGLIRNILIAEVLLAVSPFIRCW